MFAKTFTEEGTNGPMTSLRSARAGSARDSLRLLYVYDESAEESTRALVVHCGLGWVESNESRLR